MTISLLMVAVEFAPVQTTGAFRPLAFAKYLPEFGIQPTVITITPEDAANLWHAPVNNALLEHVPQGVRVHRLSSLKPVRREGPKRRMLRRLVTLGDGIKARYSKPLMDLIEMEPALRTCDTVYVTVPPFGTASLGALAAKLAKAPIILDLRDAWSQADFGHRQSYLHYLVDLKEEQRAFDQTNCIITVTDRLRTLVLKNNPQMSHDHIEVIENGFDGPLLGPSMAAVNPGKEVFNICYIGEFYWAPPKADFIYNLIRPHRWLLYHPNNGDWSYRSPLYFFHAWRKLMEWAPDIAQRIRFHHIGTKQPWLAPLASMFGLEDFCHSRGYVAKEALPALMDDMDVFLATCTKRPPPGDYAISLKTFDYFTSAKPVLAFVTEGIQRDVLERSGIGIICDPDDPVGAAESIRRLVVDGIQLQLNHTYVNQFHRREAARRLARVIEQVTGKSNTQEEREEAMQTLYI